MKTFTRCVRNKSYFLFFGAKEALQIFSGLLGARVIFAEVAPAAFQLLAEQGFGLAELP